MSKAWRDMSQREKDGRGGAKWRRMRLAVLARDAGICWMCGRPGADQADHYPIRLKDGGPSTMDNLRAAHGRKQPWGCPGNLGRGNRKTPLPPRYSREW